MPTPLFRDSDGNIKQAIAWEAITREELQEKVFKAEHVLRECQAELQRYDELTAVPADQPTQTPDVPVEQPVAPPQEVPPAQPEQPVAPVEQPPIVNDVTPPVPVITLQ